jgi:hypothetical protein
MNKNALILIAIVVLGIGAYLIISNNKSSTDTTNQAPVVTSGENPQPGGIHDLPVEPAAATARKDLAAKLSVDEKSIVIMEVKEMTWNDGCLGLGGPAESCLQALVPGFRVEMLAKGKTYFYRTDKTGATIRAETQ